MDTKNTILGAVVSAVVSTLVALAIVLMLGHGSSTTPKSDSSGDPSVGVASRAYDVDLSVKSLTLAASSTGATRDGANWTINGIGEGTCNLSQSVAGSHSATSSKEYFCAFTGARSGDTVIVTLPPGAGAYSSGSLSLYGGFVTNGSGFATTSNVIGVNIANLTGAATSSFPQATTTAHILIVR